MENPVVKLFSSIHPMSGESMSDLEGIIRFQKLPKNKDLLKVGQVAENMYFIHKGLARVYYHWQDKDVTDYFAIDGQFIGAVPSLFTQVPSRKAIHLLEDSEVYSFAAKDFEACCAKHHDLERAARRLCTFGLMQEQERIESLRFCSASERYFELEKKYPGITNRCPLQYIASYIGTSQVSVSRIRAGIQ